MYVQHVCNQLDGVHISVSGAGAALMSDLTDPEGFPLYSIDDYKQQYKSSILTFSRN